MGSAPRDLHLDRARAGSFGSVASLYDRYRPAYPAALIDDLAALRPAAVLDAGCGTGRVAVALAAQGLPVLGVEPDPRMAAVARDHGVEVQLGAFEHWDPAGRTFDLVTCGAAWHWIDPVAGVAKTAEVLRAGGTVARFWTTSVPSDDLVAAIDPVYRRYAPEIDPPRRPAGSPPRPHAAAPDLFARSGAFAPVELRTYQWDQVLDADAWVGLLATISDHQGLGPDRLTALLDAIRATLDTLGGTVHARWETYALFSVRV